MKKLAIPFFLLFTATTVLLFEGCQSTKSSTSAKMLKFNLENGKGYDYEMTMNMDQEVQGQKIKLDMATYYSMNVNSAEGDMREITAAIDRFKISTSAAGFNMDIDTDKPMPPIGDSSGMEKNPLQMVNKMFGAIKGQKFTMKVNAEGKVMEVKGFETMAQSLVDSLGLEGTEKEQVMQQFNNQFNGQQISSQLDRFWYIFPNKEVKVGDSWEKNSDLSGQFPGKYNSKYTVSEIEGDMVTLDEDTKVLVEEQNIKLDGKITGKIVVDSRIGLVVKADQDLNMTASGNGQSFQIKGKTNIKGKAR